MSSSELSMQPHRLHLTVSRKSPTHWTAYHLSRCHPSHLVVLALPDLLFLRLSAPSSGLIWSSGSNWPAFVASMMDSRRVTGPASTSLEYSNGMLFSRAAGPPKIFCVY